MLDLQKLTFALAALNLIAFALYGFDKFRSQTSKARRVSEKTLLLFTAFAASPGALLGMVLFNHKTAKPKFRYGVPAILAAHAALWYWLVYK